jgi:predicted glycoside hydrolase/deacetylase ChbG (UPF0249 family)
MLIINADDFGENKLCTDRIISCFKKRTVTSASAMVFTEDSGRSAELALDHKVDVGLHLNFSLKFSGNGKLDELCERQARIANFLTKTKYHVLIYNPALMNHFKYVFKAQYEEFIRLYGKEPSHINGHRHFHLCMNMMIGGIIPGGSKIRRNFTFQRGEKNVFNRLYRRIMDRVIMRKYIITDHFFDIFPITTKRVSQIVNYARSEVVELMVHPKREGEYAYLMSDEFWQLIQGVQCGSFLTLESRVG